MRQKYHREWLALNIALSSLTKRHAMRGNIAAYDSDDDMHRRRRRPYRREWQELYADCVGKYWPLSSAYSDGDIFDGRRRAEICAHGN